MTASECVSDFNFLKSDGLVENDSLSLAVTSIICCLLLLLVLSAYLSIAHASGQKVMINLLICSMTGETALEDPSNISLKSDGLVENDYLSLAVTSIICCLLLLLALSTDLAITLASGHR